MTARNTDGTTTLDGVLDATIALKAVTGAASTVSLPTGATGVSATIDCTTSTLRGFTVPATWTTAALTFSISYDNSTFGPYFDTAGVEYTIPSTVMAQPGYQVILPLADFIGIPYIRLRSGTKATPVSQASDRTIAILKSA